MSTRTLLQRLHALLDRIADDGNHGGMENAFSLDKFTFLELEIHGSMVFAKLRESEGFSRPVYTQDEAQVHSLLEGTIETIESGNNKKIVHRNREQLSAAFQAIRTYKTQHGIPFDVRIPCA